MSTPDGTSDHDVIIVGAGFGGICAAIELRAKGIERVLILEKAGDLGGTWRDNTYPNAACDVMSLMYSYSFAPNPRWTRGYARQPEILDYLRTVADDFGLSPTIRYHSEVTAQRFDDDRDLWEITTSDGTTRTARVVIDATGPLHIPNVPDVPGIDTFNGKSFHSAQWDHTCDLSGKRVAVIGTGASAVQLIPAVAARAAHLHVYQRTAPWVLPKPDRPITKAERIAHRSVPGLHRLARAGVYLSHEALIGAFLNPRYMPVVRAVAAAHMRRQVRDPQLRTQLTPDYEIGCKRMVMDNAYYPSLQRDDVSLHTDPIQSVTATGIRTANGLEHEVDVIIFGTGFHVNDKWVNLDLVGVGGHSIGDIWRNGPESYYGMSTHGLPNYFTIMGPNTGVGNQSIVFMIEAQARYISALLRAMIDREATRIEVKSHVQQQFNRDLQRKSRGTVWTTGGCTSWYLDQHGVNRAIWPASTVSYWRRTRTPRLGDYEFTRAEDRDHDDEYHGSAVLLDDDDTQYPVRVHLLSVYQPVDRQVHWFGRIEPTEALRQLHARTHQPIRIRIGEGPVTGATLADSDPWGGSRITGTGTAPFAHVQQQGVEQGREFADA